MPELMNIQLDFLPADTSGIYLVGGTVRDFLMGLPPADVDLVVDGDIAEIARQIAGNTGGRIVELGNKGFDVLRIAAARTTIDITRLDHPSIESDLLNRDFTINAMAYDVKRRRLVDCTGGVKDIKQKKIRMVSAAAFKMDPARLVRAYRMAAVFQFEITPHTQEAICTHRHRIGTVAGERVWAELFKMFNTPDSTPTIQMMVQSGLLTEIFPELQPAIGCTQNQHHDFDVFDHSIQAYYHLEKILTGVDNPFLDLGKLTDMDHLAGYHAILKYSALLHDVGKPATRQEDDVGRVRFPGHAGKSAEMAAVASKRLKLSRKQRDAADAIIRHHIRPLFLFISHEKGTLGRQGVVRFFNRCQHLSVPIIIHTMADVMAKSRTPRDLDNGFITFGRRLLEEYIAYRKRQETVPPLINGHDLISVFGLTPSPRFAQILNQVDEMRLTGELRTRQQALKWAGANLLRNPSHSHA